MKHTKTPEVQKLHPSLEETREHNALSVDTSHDFKLPDTGKHTAQTRAQMEDWLMHANLHPGKNEKAFPTSSTAYSQKHMEDLEKQTIMQEKADLKKEAIANAGELAKDRTAAAKVLDEVRQQRIDQTKFKGSDLSKEAKRRAEKKQKKQLVKDVNEQAEWNKKYEKQQQKQKKEKENPFRSFGRWLKKVFLG